MGGVAAAMCGCSSVPRSCRGVRCLAYILSAQHPGLLAVPAVRLQQNARASTCKPYANTQSLPFFPAVKAGIPARFPLFNGTVCRPGRARYLQRSEVLREIEVRFFV